MNQHYLQLYADFIVKVGVNVAPAPEFYRPLPGHDARLRPCLRPRGRMRPGPKTVVVRWE